MTPAAATHIVVRKEAMRQPKAEFRKLTASLLTPTKRSKRAKAPQKDQQNKVVLLHF